MPDGNNYVITTTDTFNTLSNLTVYKDAVIGGREEAIIYGKAPLLDADVYRVYIPNINVNVQIGAWFADDSSGIEDILPSVTLVLDKTQLSNSNVGYSNLNVIRYSVSNPLTGEQITSQVMPLAGEYIDLHFSNNKMTIKSPNSYGFDDVVVDFQAFIDSGGRFTGLAAQIWSHYADAFIINGTQPYYSDLPAVKIERVACAQID